MSDPIIQQIINKHQADREVLREMRKRHAAEIREIEEFQAKREAALLERGDLTCFDFFVDLFINGRDGKAEKEKEKENISLNQTKIEAWLLKMLSSVGEGIKTAHGTVYKTRKESVTCEDFELFVRENMVKSVAKVIAEKLLGGHAPEDVATIDSITNMILENIHLEFLNKAIAKAPVLELMGEQAKDGSRPNTPPLGAKYVALTTVGVRKSK